MTAQAASTHVVPSLSVTTLARISDAIDEHNLAASEAGLNIYVARTGDRIHECFGLQCAQDLIERFARKGIQLAESRAGMDPRVEREYRDELVPSAVAPAVNGANGSQPQRRGSQGRSRSRQPHPSSA